MVEFITVADVDALLPADWAGDGDPELAVMQANAYLSGLTFKPWDDQPEAITRAGAELAREAANNRLYADSEGVVQQERVKADTVEVSTTFAAGSTARSGALRFVDALLAPWIIKRSAVQFLRRV